MTRSRRYRSPAEIVGTGLFLVLAFVLGACSPGGANSDTVFIEEAAWSGERIEVTGGWARGISTPPTCRVLAGPNGPISREFVADARVAIDGNTFSKEFIPTETNDGDSSATEENYYVRCTVSLDSGRSAEDTVSVSGSR